MRDSLLRFLVPVCLATFLSGTASAGTGLELRSVLVVDGVGVVDSLSPAADVLSLTLYRDAGIDRDVLRIAFLSLGRQAPPDLKAALASASAAPVELIVTDRSSPSGALLGKAILNFRGSVYVPTEIPGDKARPGAVWTVPADPDALYLTLPRGMADGADSANPLRIGVRSSHPIPSGTLAADEVEAEFPADKAYQANCALVLHGNQGLGYSDVFHGRSDDLEGSGFDEALQVHQGTGVPGNFHLSGTLQSSAAWAANNGDPTDFNAWLAAGVTAGWAGMVTSAYAQHIMPFATDDMNDWAVAIQAQMTDTRYGYFPTVAWVPERVWLNTGSYPGSGVNDWIGDNWTPHGVGAVILDDDVHLSGHDNHQIHTLSGSSLRLVPRDRSFTGNIVGGNGQASLDILTGLAGSGVGEFRIAVLAEDWEAIGEMGGWAGITPNAKETYDWFVGKCSTESAWLSTWKLADAVANPDFTGSTITVTPGTYTEIGGFAGYGGGDNGWYTHWAGFVPYANGGDGSGSCAGAGGNCKDYGTLWSDAYNALMAAPDNNISQAGWYVLMTNLHETAWHDYLGGPISGWQHRYSAHIKNAMIYAEAAHWANGDFAVTTAAFTSDVDNDGYLEVVMHNDRLFGVFEGNGGRLTHLFVKGTGAAGKAGIFNDTAIGVDNASWSDTEGDFNDANHVGAFSEVSPNYQHDGYGWAIGPVDPAGPTVTLTLTRNEVAKTVELTEGDSFFDVVYDVGPATHWIQAGFSPSLVDLVWNAQMDRIWAPDAAYMGQRNPNTGVTAAWILGTGGAGHQRDFSGTLMKGDEIKGEGVFQLRLFAGVTSAPDGSGDVAELRAMVPGVTDTIGPAVIAAVYYPSTDRLQLTFDQVVSGCDPSGVAVVEGAGAVTVVPLPGSTPVSETGPAITRTFALDAATAAAVEALAGDLYLTLDTGAALDESGVGNLAVAAGQVPVDVAGTAVAIDGNIEAGEWENAQALADSNDSAWTAANEIDRLLVHWDQDYLYLAIDGQVSSNSWLLYLDVDPGTANGETDLTSIDAWERGASFSAPGFAPDFQYGCYQHQSVWDGDGFWQLLSPTATQDRSGEIESAFDSYHTFGDASGSEIAIPWNTLYGLGSGNVPAGAQLALAASICWDPEPGGELGGDSVPDNLSASLPVIDDAWTVTVDGDGDGRPDGSGLSPVPAADPVLVRLLPNVPNPFNPVTTIHFEVSGSGAVDVELAIYDLRGRLVTTLVRGSLTPGAHEAVWDGRAADGRPVSAGTYFSRLQSCGLVWTRPLSLVK